MKKQIVLPLVAIFVAATICLGLLAQVPPAGGQSQPPPAKLTTDQKLDRILDRLDKIEKRLSALESPAPGLRAATPPSNRAVMRARSQAMSAKKLPDLAAKPTPHSSKYRGCDFGRHHRADWDPEDLAAVKRYEGLPISIVGYFAWAQDEGPESCNCHIEDKGMYDIHTWLVKEPAQIEGSHAPDRSHALVAEVTPRLKPEHAQWTQATFRRLARQGTMVRLSGWLLLDQEHPEQLKSTATRNATRGTLWEIHPIMEIEVWENGEWVPLDDLHAAAIRVACRAAA